MAISAADVKNLREMTGVGMMDCKKALTECDGDIDKAIEYLREKGLAASAKKAGRIAAEGMAYATVIDGVGVVVEVNAETDFVGKNEKFQNFVKGVAAVVAKEDPKDLEALMAAPYGNGRTVEQERQEMVLVIGENIQVRRFARFAANTSTPYIHAGGKIGVLVNFKVDGGIDATEIAKDVAMQIAALNPRFWDKSQVSQDVLDEEKKIMMAQMANDPKMASKPEQVREKIVMGKLNKFYSENCLLQQEFVRGDVFTGTVEQYIADAAKKLGGKIDFVDAVRFEKGEGIEKKQENFAEEIASMIKGYVPPYYTTVLNYTVSNLQGYTTEQTHEGWMVTFSTSLFSASNYTFTFEIFSRTGGANLTVTNPWYNAVQYSGTISQLY